MIANRTGAVALLALAMAGTTATAQVTDGPSCGDYKFYPGIVDIHHVDRGESGLSVGDERIGQFQLVDGDGNEVAWNHFRSVIIPSREPGTYRLVGNGTEIYPNGTINWSGSYLMADPTVNAPPPEKLVVSIVGGTGDFAGAGGKLTWFYDDQGKRTAAYEVICPK